MPSFAIVQDERVQVLSPVRIADTTSGGNIPPGTILCPAPTGPYLGGLTMKKQISDALISKANTAEWISVSRDDSKQVIQGNMVQPGSVRTNETSASFGADPRHGQSLRDKRTFWEWELCVAFDEEVIMERFEQECVETPILIDATTTNPACVAHLIGARYNHPAQKGSSQGSSAVFRFNVKLCR